MARYIMANRRAGKFREAEKLAARAAVERCVASMAGKSSIVADLQPDDPTARRVVLFDAEPADVHALKVDPDVLIEPEILHWHDGIAPADFVSTQGKHRVAQAPTGSEKMVVEARGNGVPLSRAKALLFLRGPNGVTRNIARETDERGTASFTFNLSFVPSALVIEPAGGFWPMVVRGPGPSTTVNCLPLPREGPLGWWHRLMGITRSDRRRGTGIRVGVADTGVGPNRLLNHVHKVGAFIHGASLPPSEVADVESHGTHVAGIIAARPRAAGQFMGIAPGVDLYCARIFPPSEGANQGDIANAIDALSRTHRVDLINLSLGSPSRSNIELDAIRDARERGTLCICAAANDAGPVEFPAAFEECVAVSAIGLLGWGPPGTLPATRLPEDSHRFGTKNLYLANFSCFGSQVTCTAPGVGIISTVPEREGITEPFAAMDGTSMAAPLVCGVLAGSLAGRPDYLQLTRDEVRAEMARQILRETCRDIGLLNDFEGRGVPTLQEPVPEPHERVRGRRTARGER